MGKYSGLNLREISFPLGGIGAGSVGLSGNGRLIDWEIFNRPNKNSVNGYTNFAIKAETNGEVLDVRLLQGDTQKDFMGGEISGYHSWGVGHGPCRATLAGIKHFENIEFEGAFPMATITYNDKNFPGNVKMEAFNPFIPSNDEDSSIPSAFFNFTISNNTNIDVDYTIAFSCYNFLHKKTINKIVKANGNIGISMTSDAFNKKSPKFGSGMIATDCNDTTYQEYWYRSGWFDDVTTFWREFSTFGKLKNRNYNAPISNDLGNGDMCTLAGSVNVKAGETKNIKFVLSWYFPNFEKYWGAGISNTLNKITGGIIKLKKPIWKNYYSKLFNSAEDVSDYCFKNWNRLYEDTNIFKNALFNSSIPMPMLDAIQGTMAVLKSSTCIRLPDGKFYAFEGTNKTVGSCEGTCDHVWGYAYALPYLFPKLERSIREITYTYNVNDFGKTLFRTMLPLGRSKRYNRACVDGQFGNVMKFYREWKICGDDDWLKKYWPKVKKTIEFAWNAKNDDKWDLNQAGIITGRQHHTLDMELFGANAWLTGYYLGALKAGSKIAEYLGEKETEELYKGILIKGQKWMENNLFNGKHYIQTINLKDKLVLKGYKGAEYYWNNETNEIKYQIQNGCEIDQCVAQWHSNIIGLGDIFNKHNCKTAMQSLFRINFKSMRNISNPCRIFALDDEKGIVICGWEEGCEKPKIPIPYTEETMTGFEYAAACNFLINGLEDEAIEVVSAIRNRYKGDNRNPWSEIECGNSYSRSMASYSFLLAYSGFKCDMTKNMIGFDPIHFNSNYSTFWSVNNAWGVFKSNGEKITLKILYGKINLRCLALPKGIEMVNNLNIKGIKKNYEFLDNNLIFENTTFDKNDKLVMEFRKYD